MNPQPAPWWSRSLRNAAHACALILLLAAPPAALTRFTGWPLPHTSPRLGTVRDWLTQPISEQTLINVLACTAWITWLLLALALLIELVAVLRGRATPQLPGLKPLQTLAATLIGSATLTLIPTAARTLAPLPATASADVISTAPLRPTTTTSQQPTSAESTTAQTPRTTPERRPPRTHRVVSGDTLWDIAEHHLGAPERWPEIYKLNRGRPQPNGSRLADPDVIHPGWVLLLPNQPLQTTPPKPRTPQPGTSPAPAQPPHPKPQPAPSTSNAPTSKPTPKDRSTPPPTVDHDEPGQHHHPTTLTLPSEAIIGTTLAAAIALAITLSRLHQRRRRHPSPDPGTTPAEPPLPPALSAIRHHHLQAQEHPTPAPTEQPPPQPGPETEHEPPEAINAATDGTHEIPLHLDRTFGIGLTGDGAPSAARALALTLLTHPPSPPERPQVILTTDDAHQLFGPLPQLEHVPGLTLTPTLGDALTNLETEIIHRRRLLENAATSDLTTYRTQHPDDPLPTILLIAQPDTHLTDRTAAVLTLGRSIGIIGLLLTPWRAGTATIDANGHVIATDGRTTHHLQGTRMFHTTRDDAVDILTTLTAAHGHTPPDPTPPPQPRQLPQPEHNQASEPEDVRVAPTTNPTPTKPVSLTILGPFQLTACGTPITKGLRRKGLELLAYLALHPDGATTATLAETLWPGLPDGKAIKSLYTVTANIRTTLRTATDHREAEFIQRRTDRYQLDPTLIDVDLWRFQQALARHAHATTDTQRIQALKEAAMTWPNDLEAWPSIEWFEPWQETLRRDLTDTLSRLATHLAKDHPDQALTHLQQAIHHDPYAEELYRRTMHIQATLNEPDAIRRTYNLLQNRLTDLDTEPENETQDLLHNLTSKPQL